LLACEFTKNEYNGAVLVVKELGVRKLTIRFTVLLCLIALSGWQTVEASPVQQDPSICLISSPASGSQLRGEVVITGTATHPDFTWYQIGYAPDPNPDGKWKFFYNSETAVASGRLGVWNTTQIPDGTYQLILEVHRSDSNNDHCFVQKLRVNNTAPTATFTAVPLPTSANTPTPLPTAADTPTVAIEQPPTATPRATPTYSAVNNPTPTPQMTRIQLPIEATSIRTASCRGAQIAVVVAVIATLYFIIRNAMASGIRKVWKRQNVEGFHTRRPRQQ
jgi:hypothetical protein